jgi:hypothetical protein
MSKARPLSSENIVSLVSTVNAPIIRNKILHTNLDSPVQPGSEKTVKTMAKI